MNEGQLGDDQGRCFESHRHQRTTTSTVTSPDNSVKNDKKKKVYIYFLGLCMEPIVYIDLLNFPIVVLDQVHYSKDFYFQETI